MRAISRQYKTHHLIIFSIISLAILVGSFVFARVSLAADASEGSRRIITVHDDGKDIGFATEATTLREALKDGGIRLDERDRTEPSLDEELVSNSYQVNIYRARPVLIREGASATTFVTAYRTGQQIASDANIELRDEDLAELSPSTDPLADGAAEVLTITRAKEFKFVFYGQDEVSYTRSSTVGDMLREKGIKMSSGDEINPDVDKAIVSGMTINLWRNGEQTITTEEDVKYSVKQIYDANQRVGYRSIKTSGTNGRRTVTYVIDMRNGKEVSRKEINSVTIKQAVAQVEIVGVKSDGDALTKSKGVVFSIDSKGVTHRETYYDLRMSVVMSIAARVCGVKATYTVRADGVKVDKDGYILVAANLARYPRCSIVETSLGPGKVYDTGGFVAVHPDGFDIATDWTNPNGI